MMTTFKVESGMQMLARLTRKPDIENFYPKLFRSGPKLGQIIEIYSEDDVSLLLCDIICDSLIPRELGGTEAGVVIINTDGKLYLDIFVKHIKRKLHMQINDDSLFNKTLQKVLSSLFIFEVFNITQLHATIHNLNSLLISQPNVSLIILDTLTAFYWSEQGYKIMKMDLYIKDMLRFIQNVLKDYKVAVMYTRPQYFSSSKAQIEDLDACCENSSHGHLNYRIHIVYSEDGRHYAAVRTFNDYYKCAFKLLDDDIIWL